MWSNGRNRVSPLPDNDTHEMEMDNYGGSGDEDTITDRQNEVYRERRRSDLPRKRGRKSWVAGTEEYGNYVDRIFNERQAWTPYLGQRIRDKLLAPTLHPTRGWAGWKYRHSMRWHSAKLTWREWTSGLELWRGSLKAIEGLQGTGVASYFVFLKWLLFLNVFIFLTMALAVVLFQVAFNSAGFTMATTGVVNSATFPGLVLSDSCTGMYSPEAGADVGLRILDFFQGTGWMEKTSFFYGYYGNSEVALPGGSRYNMPLAYILATIVIMVVSLFVMVRHMVSKYMAALLTSDDNQHRYRVNCLVFASWDYRICQARSTTLQHRSVYHTILGDIEEVRHEQMKTARTSGQTCCVWLTRTVVNVVILLLLVGAAAAIYYAMTYSLKFTTTLVSDEHHGLVVVLVEYLPAVIIAVLNGIFPVCFNLLVKLEHYRPAFVIRITILRIVFVRLVALAVITVTVYLKITCTPTDQCLIGQDSCLEIPCWETYVGQVVYKLLMIEFLADVLETLAYQLPRKLITTKCNCGVISKLGPAVFAIPPNVLDLVYAQALCWLGFFFAPLLPAMCILRLLVLFYLRKLSALYTTVPPKRPYQTAKSNAFFMVTLLIAFFMACIPVGYSIVKLQPSPMCGPFRIYEQTTDILNIQIDGTAEWFRDVWGVVTSSAVVCVAILLMALGLYYCYAMRSASKKTILKLRHLILKGEKDKQFLLSKLEGEPITDRGKLESESITDRGILRQQFYRDTMYKPSARKHRTINNNDNKKTMPIGAGEDVDKLTEVMPGVTMRHDYNPNW